jgi:DNA-binding PadR family transcriptional regulator
MPSKELIAASSRPLILSILAEGESYGYAIIQRVRELSGGQLEWTEGMLYPVLHRLERQGLVKSVWRTAETGRKRKYYKILKQGTAALVQERQQWLNVHEALAGLWNIRVQPT